MNALAAAARRGGRVEPPEAIVLLDDWGRGRGKILSSAAFSEPGGNSIQPILIHHSHSNIYGQNREV
jgi:hypothetical protein